MKRAREQARRMLEEGVFSYAAFFAEQAALKALKAYLLARGERAVQLGRLLRTSASSSQFSRTWSLYLGNIPMTTQSVGLA